MNPARTCWTLVVPFETPSQNIVEGWLKHHPWRIGQLKNEWYARLFFAARAWAVPKATGKRRITITRVFRGELDQDNFIGGCKHFVLDNLTPERVDWIEHKKGPKAGTRTAKKKGGLGLLVDDSPKWVECVYHQRRPQPGERPCTIIVIEECP